MAIFCHMGEAAKTWRQDLGPLPAHTSVPPSATCSSSLSRECCVEGCQGILFYLISSQAGLFGSSSLLSKVFSRVCAHVSITGKAQVSITLPFGMTLETGSCLSMVAFQAAATLNVLVCVFLPFGERIYIHMMVGPVEQMSALFFLSESPDYCSSIQLQALMLDKSCSSFPICVEGLRCWKCGATLVDTMLFQVVSSSCHCASNQFA